MKLYFCILILICFAIDGLANNSQDEKHFLMSALGKQPVPQNLGSYPYDCFGDLNYCTNGFSLFFWHKAMAGSVGYLISSGGQSATSNGFYVRELKEGLYEAGVAKSKQLWSVTFSLATESWSNVALTWSDLRGLTLYVDAIKVTTASASINREYQYMFYDTFTNVTIGKANDMPTSSVASLTQGWAYIGNVTHISSELTEAAVADFIEPSLSSLMISCSQTSTVATATIPIVGNTNAVWLNNCRHACSSQGKQIAVYKQNQICSCQVATATLASQSLCDPHAINMYSTIWSTHYQTLAVKDISSMMKLTSSSAENTFLKGEAAVILVSSSSAEQIINLKFDFQDGVVVVSGDQSIEHIWSAPGVFTVTATPVNSEFAGQLTLSVNITDVLVGDKPTNLILKADLNSMNANDVLETIYAGAYSAYPATCRVYDDATILTAFNITVGAQSSQTYFSLLNKAVQTSQLECRNMFGTVSVSTITPTYNPPSEFWVIDISKTATLSFSDCVSDSVTIMADRSSTLRKDNSFHADISKLIRGEHIIDAVFADSMRIRNKIVFLKDPLNDIVLTVSANSAKLGDSIDFTVYVQQAQDAHAMILYGDGNIEYMFLPGYQHAVTISKSYTYSNLGEYLVEVYIANELGSSSSNKVISIEQPITRVELQIQNSTSLQQSAVFKFNLDTAGYLLPWLQLDIDYGNNIRESVMLYPYNTTSSIFIKNYVYDKYGLHFVKATIKNNISSVVLPQSIVQIGENLTEVDVRVDDYLVSQGAEVVLRIYCPTGSPIQFTVNMGDNQIPIYFAYPPTFTLSDNFGTSSRSLTNKTTQYIQAGDVYIFRYKYKSVGTYRVSVQVTNIFSYTETKLCPEIIVAPTASAPNCNRDVVSIANVTTVNTPIVVHRSNQLTLSALFTTNCPLSKPGFTWTFELLTARSTWKPELQVCATNIPTSYLHVPEDTLWYGLYRVNVSMIANQATPTGGLRATTSHIFAEKSAYVRIIPSPLAASMNQGKDMIYSMSEVISVNMTSSYDPDVSFNNKTGFKFHLFCSKTTDMSGKILTAMQQQSEIVESSVDVTFYQLKTERCFDHTAKVMIIEHEAVFMANNLTITENFKLTLYVEKDSRISSQCLTVTLISSNFSGNLLNSIDELLKKGNTNAALFVLDIVTNNLNSGSNSDSENNAKDRSDQRGQVINLINHVGNQIQNADQLIKTTQVMSDVTSNSAEVSGESKKNASEGINNVAGKAVNLTANSNIDQVKGIANSVLSTAGSILPFAPPDNSSALNETHKERRRRSLLSRDEEKIANSTLPCCEITPGLCDWIEPDAPGVDDIDRKLVAWDDTQCKMIYPCEMVQIRKRYQEYLDEQKAIENRIKKGTTQNGMNGVSTVAGILVNKQSGGDGGQLGLSTGSMNLSVSNFNSGKPPSVDGDYEIPDGAGGCGAMMMASPNPFTYSSEPTGVSGSVKTLSLTSCDGKPLQIDNSSKPFVLWMDGSPVPIEYKYYKIWAIDKYYTNNTHTIIVADNGSVIYAHFDILEGEEYEVLLQINDFPNDTYNIWKTNLPNKDRNILPANRYVVNPPHNLTEVAAKYYFLVRYNLNKTFVPLNISYGLYTFVTACRYWNDNASVWDTSGCEVGPLTSPQKTQCMCTHLTSFGGSFAVAPNTIDFNTVFSLENFLESMPVFCTIIAILILYIIAMVWARHMDKKDIKRWGALPLEDNLPSESYHYQLSVYTGLRKNAGTTSKPCFVLSGDEGDTGIRRLEDGKRKNIGTGSINNYILSVDNCLGPLTFLRIWHDNSGNGSKRGWFLDQIEVTDLQTGERFFFVCARWLAVEEDDGAIERIIPVAGKDDLTQFKQLFTHSLRKKFSNDHIWVSVFSRPTKSSFTRVQRISCCVSLLFMTMITNCMFFKATDPDQTTSVHIGPIVITLQQIYISVVTTLIILPPSVTIVMIFKKVRPRHNAVEQMNLAKKKSGWRSFTPMEGISENATLGRKVKDTFHHITSFARRSKYQADEVEVPKKKKAMTFPWWTIYIAWILVFFMVVAPAFFTILYSMQWGREKSLAWLQTFFLSFFQSVIVVQPIKVLALAALLSCILKKPDIEEEEDAAANFIASDEMVVNEASKKDIEALKRRRQQSVAASNNLPSPAQLKASREQRLHEMEIEAILKECLMYIIFILVLYFISYQDKDSRSFTFVTAITNRYINSGDPSFKNIKTQSDAITFINNTVIPNLYTTGWYDGTPPNDWREAMQMQDHVSIRLGVGRLRQLRIKENSCKILPKFRQLIEHCRNDYNWLDDDTASYNVSWSDKFNKTVTKEAKGNDVNKHNAWLYRDSIELKNSPYLGIVNTYKGGGYTYNFYCDSNKTQVGLGLLAANNWLDVRTRALFVEFTVYNANANLFASTTMLIEWLSTGSPILSYQIQIFRLSSYVGPFGAIIILFQLIYIGFVIYFSSHAINLIRKQRKAYFKSFWNLLEFVTILMSVVTIAMYGMKMVFGSTAMDVIKDSGSSEYVNFAMISSWVEMYSVVLAILVFLVTIKFIHMLKFNRRLSMLTDTIGASIKDLKMFMITFFLYILAFAFLGYLLFSSKLQSYSQFTTTLQTLFQFFIQSFTFSDYLNAEPILGPIYFFMFVWLIVFGMQTMFLVIIIEAFQAVRKEAHYKRNDYEVGDFIFKKIKGIVGLG